MFVFGWVVGWASGWMDRLTDRQTGRQTGYQLARKWNRLTDDRWTDRLQMNRRTDRLTEGRMGQRANGHTGRQIEHTYECTDGLNVWTDKWQMDKQTN